MQNAAFGTSGIHVTARQQEGNLEHERNRSVNWPQFGMPENRKRAPDHSICTLLQEIISYASVVRAQPPKQEKEANMRVHKTGTMPCTRILKDTLTGQHGQPLLDSHGLCQTYTLLCRQT